jgi:hypothetical protein
MLRFVQIRNNRNENRLIFLPKLCEKKERTSEPCHEFVRDKIVLMILVITL